MHIRSWFSNNKIIHWRSQFVIYKSVVSSLFPSTADDPFDNFFGGSHSRHRGASRGTMGGSRFGFGSFPAFGPSLSGFNSGPYVPTKDSTLDHECMTPFHFYCDFCWKCARLQVLTPLETWVEGDSPPSHLHLLVGVEEEEEAEWLTSNPCRPPPSSSTAEKLQQNGN